MDHIAYFAVGASEEQSREIANALDDEVRRMAPELAREVRFYVENAAPRLAAKLRLHNADALIIDARGEDGALDRSPALAMLSELFQEHELAGPVSRARTWIVVRPDPRGTTLAFEAGRSRIAGCIPIGEDGAWWREIWRLLEQTVRLRHGGKTAICLAGGGIEGGFYEMGVLRALQYFLPEFRLQDVDVICGISVGSIIGAFLANGLSPDEVMLGMKTGQGRLDRLRRTDAFDPNLAELVHRLGGA
ncbi:MAG: patatin-like phospholipase family protein, partial [Polyangiaceae bacterium]|nr:patatin-like phospholipase family protein [Polyangiaceae bacterium]